MKSTAPRGSFAYRTRLAPLTRTMITRAILAWLGLHESPATQCTYRKEAERLILWSNLGA